MTMLDDNLARRFMALTLGHLEQEYPSKLDHVLTTDADAACPRALHPVFFGSFDWHSCVHGWWQVLHLARRFPDNPEAAAVRARADAMLVADKLAGELAYLDRPFSQGFERPYGWGWLLALHGEAERAGGYGWGAALRPLAEAFAARFREFLPKLTYPIRTGTHGNIAFACLLALDWATTHDSALARLIGARAHDWFGADRGCQAWEPGGDEFLSPALSEAALMSRVIEGGAFAEWFDGFLPDAAAGRPASLFTPAEVSDRSDGKIAHLDGLNLSRAWQWRMIAARLGAGHRVHDRTLATAERHLEASLPHIADDYMGTHWLASFAVLALG